MEMSIIIPVYNERKFIPDILFDLHGQKEVDFSQIECIFIDGNSTDGTKDFLEEHIQKLPFKVSNVLSNPLRSVPISMNMGIKHSRGRLICRLDAHCRISDRYFRTLIDYHKSSSTLMNVGFVLNTVPRSKTAVAEAIAYVLSSIFGVGNSSFRIGVNNDIFTDTVPFGCYKRSVFDNVGFFNEKLKRNQDIEFNSRIKNAGFRQLLSNKQTITYLSRDSIIELCNNNYSNGLWLVNTMAETNGVFSMRHYIPFLFLITVIISLILTVLFKSILFMLGVFLYFILVLGFALYALKFRLKVHLVALSYICLHFSYGLGTFSGILISGIKKFR